MSQDGSDISGCPRRPPHRQLRSVDIYLLLLHCLQYCRLSKSSGSSLAGPSKPVLSAKDLTGAPLISLVPCKTRKVRPGPGPASRKYYERQRHSSEQGNIPSSYYAGQHLYQVNMHWLYVKTYRKCSEAVGGSRISLPARLLSKPNLREQEQSQTGGNRGE